MPNDSKQSHPDVAEDLKLGCMVEKEKAAEIGIVINYN